MAEEVTGRGSCVGFPENLDEVDRRVLEPRARFLREQLEPQRPTALGAGGRKRRISKGASDASSPALRGAARLSWLTATQ